MILIVLSLIMGFIGLNIGGMIGGAEIYAYLFGVVGVLSPGLFTLEQLYKRSKLDEEDKLFAKTDELDLVKLRDIEVLSNTQLEEVIEMYKKKANKSESDDQFQKYKKLLDELKQSGYFSDDQYFSGLDKLEKYYDVY